MIVKVPVSRHADATKDSYIFVPDASNAYDQSICSTSVLDSSEYNIRILMLLIK